MGAGQSYKKDDCIDIYLQTGKPFYMAGEKVQGNVYLNVHTDTNYDALYIKIQGQEYVYWSQGSGKNRRTYSNTKATYLDQFVLYRFQGGMIYNGQYAFPFAFILPVSMSGSFYNSDSNYIKYPLTAYTSSFQKKNDNQPFTMLLNIRQLPKVPKGSTQIQRMISGKCCGCCADYGNTKVTITCDKNMLNTGQQVGVQALIDNSLGTGLIQDVQLTLEERHIMVSSGGRQTYRYSQSHMLNTFPTKNVQPGAQQLFVSTPIIPKSIQNQTAIGAITARWFQLTIRGSLGCCNYDPPSAALRIFLYSSNLKLVNKPHVQAPKYWNPNLNPLVLYPNMKTFIYSPCASILILNLHQQNVTANINMPMMGMQMNSGMNMGMQPNFNTQEGLNMEMYNQNDPYQNQNRNKYVENQGPIKTNY